MGRLRNPFAVRNGNIVLIEDLTKRESGLSCLCQCPSCNGDFIARMGKTNIHHFAHSKDACDEVIAYTSGLYRLIHQILMSGIPFYVPALTVSYSVPSYHEALDESNLAAHIRYVCETDNSPNKIVVSKGKYIAFENVEICVDSKNHIEALELSYMDNRMAIKVKPPDTVCKIASVSPHKDMATLVVDFTADADIIQATNSTTFQAYFFSEGLVKYWIYNPKVKKAYSRIITLSQEAHRKYIELQKQHEEKRKVEAQQLKEASKQAIQQQISNENATVNFSSDYVEKLGHEQVKDKFNQQTKQIRDAFDKRWIKCELCGEIKRAEKFSSYGGINHVNLGKCTICSRKKERGQ